MERTIERFYSGITPGRALELIRAEVEQDGGTFERDRYTVGPVTGDEFWVTATYEYAGTWVVKWRAAGSDDTWTVEMRAADRDAAIEASKGWLHPALDWDLLSAEQL